LGNYAFLRMAEDQTNGDYQKLMARLQNVATRAGEAGSYIRPEIMEIDDAKLSEFMKAPELELYQLMIERLTRYKKHTLSEREEQLLAMQGEMAGATSKIFRQLHDADLKFGTLEDKDGNEVELSPSTFSEFLVSSDREVRKKAFHQFYEQFTAHENTLAATLAGSIQKDVYYAKARGYDSALHQALYGDNVPQTVYDNLIGAVRKNLPALYKYYDLRKRKMGLDTIHQYDTYVPILSDIEIEHSWDEAVEVVAESLAPLGEEYVSVLRKGLSGRWCDRYPNAGKQSGAFSAGCFDSEPYILMNYKPKVLNDVFTLTHEAGHSMHSYNSVKHQPFEYYSYTIFVAEVASTFNEQLLTRHMLNNAKDDRLKAYLINNEIDSIRVRIPHFYRAFYVYKYATGLSASIALSQKVLNGGESDLADYLAFLRSGCSKYPLDLLRDAGVDLESPEPVDTALSQFSELVEQLDQLL